MHTYGFINGVQFRVSHDKPMTKETMEALHKMVALASKKFTTKTKTHGTDKDQNGERPQ